MLRKLYYSIPSFWRFWVRRLIFLPEDLLSKGDSLIPPKGLIYTSRANFIEQGNAYIDLFKKQGNLQPNANFLDIGSGIGKIAIPLTKYLEGKSDYQGFDFVELGVIWCQNNISKKFTNFNFKFVPVLNNLRGDSSAKASHYQFEYPKNHFDFACSVSVFTHMVPKEVGNYFDELEKVMKRGGKIFATFFIINPENSTLMKDSSGFNFNHKLNGYYLMDANVKGANVAFDEEYLLNEIIKTDRFKVTAKNYGHWCGRNKEDSWDFQDVYIIEKL